MNKAYIYLVPLIGVAYVSADIEQTCGFAPLCGEENREFDWESGAISDDVEGSILLGAELVMQDCCKLTDTQPVEDCEIVDPSGESFRTITSSSELCGFRGEDCQDTDCSEYQIVIRPQFERESSQEACCDSCTCFGDPQCISFDGEEKIWALCDGRDVPPSSSRKKMCWITEEQCLKEKDHAGNRCQYLSDDPTGKSWKVGMNGSPCQPNPDSPPSIITMYEVEDVNFRLSLEQAERGVIKTVFLDLECGSFELTADDCLNKGDDAWTHAENSLPEFFSYNDVVTGFDEHWSVIDPDSGISVSIRCHANHYEDDDEAYVPRINVEDISDPVSRGAAGSGFCVDGEFDVGEATTSNTNFIFENDKCIGGLTQSERREIFKILCQNNAIPGSGHDSCIYHFCNRHYLPLFDSIDDCVDTFGVSLAEGFCRGITYSERDSDKCTEQWFDIGAVETIQQYYDDLQGCTSSIQTSLRKCQSGVVIQFFRNDVWNDEVAIPSDFCNDEPIVLSYCDHQYLFNRNIRILQKTANVACGPVNQCSRVDGFLATIELVKNTPAPTEFPTDSPSTSPTSFPTLFPTDGPTTSPTSFPVSPTRFPTRLNIVPECEPILCDTNNENVAYDNNEVTMELDECCIEEKFACSTELNRTQTAPEWYCGLSDGAEGSISDSVTGVECRDEDELEISIEFSHATECCRKCTCYGDPRCVAFDGSFEEFILCDGRAPGLTDEDRCVIRRDTCLEQLDHQGNVCAWTNPLKTPPDFNSASKQEAAERGYEITRYGSPCRYDESLSQPAKVLMYETDDPYKLEVEHGDRGYIQRVYLETGAGEFELGAQACHEGAPWEEISVLNSDDISFDRISMGLEIQWTVVDKITEIVLKVRCTGHLFEGEMSTTFMNVESLLEWDEDRIQGSEGFCATSQMPEKALASTEHSQELKEDEVCDTWNKHTTNALLRKVAKIISNNPSVTNIGTETAFAEFCQVFYSPTWSSVSSCTRAFMRAETVEELIDIFCEGVTRDIEVCTENLELISEESDYEEAFAQGYQLYVANFEQQCELKFSDLPESLTFDSDTCQTGVELQFFNPRKDDWITYAAFPDTGGRCTGYRVSALYDFHPKLFKNPLRIVQKHDTEHCTQCTQASSVKATFQFSSP